MRKNERIFYNLKDYAICIDYVNIKVLARRIEREGIKIKYKEILPVFDIDSIMLYLPKYLRRSLALEIATEVGLRKLDEKYRRYL